MSSGSVAILLEKSLRVLDEGVLEGRKVFTNISKYVRMGASSNFGNMFSVLGASIFVPFLPMLPIQIRPHCDEDAASSTRGAVCAADRGRPRKTAAGTTVTEAPAPSDQTSTG